jgi:hypothetical protein
LREVEPKLSLHYWDWTTDPRATPDGAGGTVNLFTPQFMGNASGDAGPPLQNFESTEGGGHTHVWRSVNGGIPGTPRVATDHEIVITGDDGVDADQFHLMRTALEVSHNNAHGYIGGSIGQQHYSFHDPFVFLLHSNVDRLWAMWQMAPGKAWRMDPALVYGTEGTAPSIIANLEPWSGGTPLRPWAPPDNQQVVKTPKDPSVVTLPRYDTLEPVTLQAVFTVAKRVAALPKERFPASLGPWQFSANGIEGSMTLTDDGTGNLSGSIDGHQSLLGFWDARTRTVTFLRIIDPSNPVSVQVYTGHLSSSVTPPDLLHFILSGSYQAFSGPGVTAQDHVFAWSASMSRPA